MGLLETLGLRKEKQLVNVDAKKPAGSQLITRIQQTALSRARQDISNWRDALSQAESKYRPDRLNLHRVYQEVVLDPHLDAVKQQRYNKVLARGFKVYNSNGDLDEEKTDLLKTKWFNDFLKYSLQTIDHGFSLIEFGSLINDEFESVTLVPREYVIPERGTFRTSLAGTKEFDFSKPPFNQWAIFVGGKYDLGLLNKATPLMLWKRLVQATWAEYNELYGVPLRVGKTGKSDKATRDNLEDMLQNLGSSAWGLFDEDDQIEIINGIKTGGHSTFSDFIALMDEQISKLYLGQTMTTDSGSSRSQAEVHAETMESFTGADLRFISHIVNKQLFPFLELKGLGYEGLKFEWDLDEKLSLTERFNIDKELLNYYNIPVEYIESTYGTPVEEKQAIEAPGAPTNGVTIMNDVSKLYDGFFKHGEGCSCGNC